MSYEILDALMSEPEDFSGVYFLRAGKSDFVKIGRAVSIRSRLKTLQTGNPFELKLEAWIETHDTHVSTRLEASIHKHARDKNFRGEWFRLSRPEVDAIINKFLARKTSPNVARVEDFAQAPCKAPPAPNQLWMPIDKYGYDRFGIYRAEFDQTGGK